MSALQGNRIQDIGIMVSQCILILTNRVIKSGVCAAATTLTVTLFTWYIINMKVHHKEMDHHNEI